MSNNNNSSNGVKHTEPISIGIGSRRQPRGRSMSVSSASSSSSYEPITPAQSNPSYPSVSPTSSSPVLSYFLAQSQSAPNKSPGATTFPFRRFTQPPVFEEDETKYELPATAHARRASVTNASRFAPSSNPVPIPESQLERGTNMLRRLSLSSGFSKSPPSPPSPPLNSAVSPTTPDARPFGTKPRRSATLSAGSGTGMTRRAPSPMGERILKGHFDGFN